MEDDGDVISLEQYRILMVLYACCGSLISIIGMGNNCINIKTFLLMGASDGVTFSFLVLSITDLVFLIARLLRTISAGLLAIENITEFNIWFPVDPSAVHFYFANIGHIVYTYTILTTTFLSLARCLCVVKPFLFKHMFTRKLSIWVLSLCFILCVVCLSPIFAYMDITNQYDKRINTSRLALFISSKRELVRKVTWSIKDVGLAIPSQALIIMCVVVTTRCLIAASKFRQRSKIGSISLINTVHCLPSGLGSALLQESILRVGSSPPHLKITPHKLSTTDLHVIQQVILISTVFITCNTPKIITTLAGLVEPRLTLGELYEKIYLSMNWLTDIFQIINATVGLFIYYKYNSKFRNVLRSYKIKDVKNNNK